MNKVDIYIYALCRLVRKIVDLYQNMFNEQFYIKF